MRNAAPSRNIALRAPGESWVMTKLLVGRSGQMGYGDPYIARQLWVVKAHMAYATHLVKS
jgi:hypothetical protein